MSENLPFLVIAAPLFGALVASLVGWARPRYCYAIAMVSLAAGLTAAIALLVKVSGTVSGYEYRLGGWPPPIGIQHWVDPLSALILVVITAVAFLAVMSARANLQLELPGKERFVYPLMLLMVTGLSGMTLTGDAFNLYVLLEITSLSSYALVAIGRGRAAASCLNYIIMGTIGASFYLLGVGYLYLKTGSLNMIDLRQIMIAGDMHGSQTVITGFILITVGFWIKMGLYPLHGWLPNAYSFAPHAASNLMAPLMTKVSVYVSLRMMLSVFTPDFLAVHALWAQTALLVATIAIIAGSLIAYSQTDVKKLLCYLVVAEVGYMAGGMWLMNRAGITGTIYHIAADAFMTCCLFLGASGLIASTGSRHIRSFRGATRRMPWTFAAFLVGGLSMIGVPPTCGFFSKWFLIQGAIEGGAWHFVAALIFSSLINALIFFRIIELAYFKDVEHEDDVSHPPQVQRNEAPWGIRIPLFITSVVIVLLGVFSPRVINWIERFVDSVGVT